MMDRGEHYDINRRVTSGVEYFFPREERTHTLWHVQVEARLQHVQMLRNKVFYLCFCLTLTWLHLV